MLCNSARRVSENWDIGALRGKRQRTRRRANAGSQVSAGRQPSARDAFLHGARPEKISANDRGCAEIQERRARNVSASGGDLRDRSGRRPMGELPEGRRPDGPVGPPQHDNSMKSGDSAIPLSRNNNPVTQPERRCVSATRISAIRIQDSGRRLGLGAWGQAPAKAGGWTRCPIAPFPDGTGYYVIAEHGRRAPARILPLAPQTSKI